MKINKFLAIIIIPLIPIVLSAQPSKRNFNRIGVGDTVPGDVPLINLVNYPAPTAYVADFKGKWLILDYWFTGCGACIQSWPKLMKLQKKYDDKIQIMSVNPMQSREVVEKFIARRNKDSKEPFLLPSVTGDTILYKILPPFGYPTIVWIDPKGVYRASTSGTDLNDSTIQRILTNNNIKTVAANTALLNLRRPLFIDENGGTGQAMLWYSTVSKYSPKIADGYFLMSADSSGYVIAGTHKPILDLIMRAYGAGPFGFPLVNEIRLPKTRIELRVKDPKRLFDRIDGIRVTDNLYTYQLISYEPRTIEQLKEIMRDDLEKYFALEMKWEKVKKKCLVLTARDTTLLGDNEIKKPRYAHKREGDTMYIRDVTISNFFGYLTEYIGGIYSTLDGYPLVNETGFKGGLDVVFDGVTTLNSLEVLRDHKKLDSILSKYGMRLKLEEREIEVLVIADAGED